MKLLLNQRPANIKISLFISLEEAHKNVTSFINNTKNYHILKPLLSNKDDSFTVSKKCFKHERV